MRLATVGQARQIDEISQSVYGLTGESLMESAGALATREIDLTYLPELTRGSVAVVCGPGNNGGDALVVARHLHSAGFRDLQIYLVAPPEKQSALFKLQRQRCELQGIRCVDLLEIPERVEQIKSAELIVDGVFGIGFSGQITEPYLKVIEVMNSAKAPKVALDTPSGLNCGTGRVEGAAVKASMTVTFGLAKPGFFVSEGPAHIGKLRVLPIGFPYEALRGIATSHFLFTERLVRRYLPVRKETSNKSDHGRLLVIAGSPGLWGAGILASSSAFRVGAGYVTWASFEAPYESLREVPEVLTAQVNDDKLWRGKISAVCIGPGLGSGKATAEVIERLKGLQGVPVVVDADALDACVDHGLFPLPENWVITPHAGELSRILKVHVQDIERDRFQAAFAAYEKAKCHVLLKGFRSLIAYGQRCMIVHAGNAALAKAGTGDVLTGMIGGLLAQGLDTPQATGTAAYLHGRLADEWVRSGNDKSSMTASDLRALLPQVVSRLRLGGSLF
ncbi:MAG: NAD(P)H-hydrate dehydratase [Bdellovibrionales bacterium]|nr:NAD(P)H-hydrate dehydratase [Bdellovibrionales bacterium]